MKKHWLNKERLTQYPRIFLALYVIGAVIWIALSHQGLDMNRKPLGYDFITFWSASHLALAGNPAGAYDLPTIVHTEHEVLPGITTINPWLYPPTFLLVVLPLALLPYFLSYFAFLGITLAGYIAVVRRIATMPGSMPLLLAFPGVYINIVQGQNGFLTAALMGASLLLLPTWPAAAGILIGLLTIKPHLGLLLPLALICGRHWRALFYASLTSAAFLIASVAVLGADTLPAFLSGMHFFSDVALHETKLLIKIPSFFSMACLLGLPPWAAYAVHLSVAFPVAAAVAWVWLHCGSRALRSAVLVAGSLLVSPYLLDYDLAWLALPIAWFAGYGMQYGWLRGDREILVAVWLLPMLLVLGYRLTHLQLAPFLLLWFFLVLLRRAREATLCQLPHGDPPGRENPVQGV